MALHVLTGSGAPATAPEFIGQHYIDQTNAKHYLANGTASVADWQEVGAGGGGTTVYTGYITTVADVLDLVVLPANWSVAMPFPGVYDISHNLSLTNKYDLVVIPTVADQDIGIAFVHLGNSSLTKVRLATAAVATGTSTAFNFFFHAVHHTP